MQLFEFVKSPPVLILQTKSESKDHKSQLFQKLTEPVVFLKEPAMNWWSYMAGYWIFSKSLRTVIIYQNQLFEFLRAMVLNLKNPHDKSQGLFIFLTTAQHHWFKPWGKVQLPFKCEPLPYTMIKHHIVAK